jgi:hypothetical protein
MFSGQETALLNRSRHGVFKKAKKEEFPGTMRCMPAGNSFPQICVVSETYSGEVGVM